MFSSATGPTSSMEHWRPGRTVLHNMQRCATPAKRLTPSKAAIDERRSVVTSQSERAPCGLMSPALERAVSPSGRRTRALRQLAAACQSRVQSRSKSVKSRTIDEFCITGESDYHSPFGTTANDLNSGSYYAADLSSFERNRMTRDSYESGEKEVIRERHDSFGRDLQALMANQTDKKSERSHCTESLTRPPTRLSVLLANQEKTQAGSVEFDGEMAASTDEFERSEELRRSFILQRPIVDDAKPLREIHSFYNGNDEHNAECKLSGTLPRISFNPPKIIMMLFKFAAVGNMPCVEELRNVGYSMLYERFLSAADKSASISKVAYFVVLKHVVPAVSVEEAARLLGCFEKTEKGDLDVNVFLMGLQMLLGCATAGDTLRYCIKAMDPMSSTPRYITRYEIQSILRCVHMQHAALIEHNLNEGVEEVRMAKNNLKAALADTKNDVSGRVNFASSKHMTSSNLRPPSRVSSPDRPANSVAVDREFSIMYSAITELFDDTSRYDYMGRMALDDFLFYIRSKLDFHSRNRRSSVAMGGVLQGAALIAPAHRLNSRQLVLQHVHAVSNSQVALDRRR